MFPLSPEKFEQQRLQKSQGDELTLSQIPLNNLNATQIENATPSALKAMGISKLPLILLVIGNKVKQIINPSLNNIMLQYINKYKDTLACPTQEEIDIILRQRNNIVTQLNRISKNLNRISLTLTGVATFLNLLQTAVKGIDIAKIAAKIAAIAFPPLAASLPSTLNTLDAAKTKILIDNEGEARIKKISSIIGGASLVTSIIAGYILIAVNLLKSIDLVLVRCNPSISLESINEDTITIADTQSQAVQTQNLTTYQGFIIEIEEIPFSPTVTRKRAIGKNQQGITLITTSLSFTTDDQTLINELKFIITRDNLKAY